MPRSAARPKPQHGNSGLSAHPMWQAHLKNESNYTCRRWHKAHVRIITQQPQGASRHVRRSGAPQKRIWSNSLTPAFYFSSRFSHVAMAMKAGFLHRSFSSCWKPTCHASTTVDPTHSYNFNQVELTKVLRGGLIHKPRRMREAHQPRPQSCKALLPNIVEISGPALAQTQSTIRLHWFSKLSASLDAYSE